MANNELSGPVVACEVIKNLKKIRNRKYNYKVVFVPETIGSICFIHENLEFLKRNVKAGFNLSCLGDERAYSFLPSRSGSTLSDKVGRHVIKWIDSKYVEYDWLERGSDERQYCAPGIDLPIASLMRTKYGEYKEYHTSLDRIGSVVTLTGLKGSLKLVNECIYTLKITLHHVAKL